MSMKKKKQRLLAGLMCSLLLGTAAAPVSAAEDSTAAETAVAASTQAAPIQEYSLEGIVIEGDSTGKTNMPGGFQNNEARFGIMAG